MREQNLRLRSEQQCVAEDTPVERLLAKAITCYKKSAPFRIPQSKRKHSVHVLDHLLAVLFIKMRQHFRVRRASERVATFFQVLSELAIIVDFTVEDDGDALVFVEGGLFAANKIDDCEPAHAERNALRDHETFRIGPAMNHALAHRMQQLFRAVRRRSASVKIGPPGNSAHKFVNRSSLIVNSES